MRYYGYHRTSTTEQHLDRGIKEITEYCENNNIDLKKIYTDQETGVNFNRPRYTVMKEDVLDSGDVLIITEIDRLGRNKKGTLDELRYFKDRGIRVMILELPTTLIDVSKLDNEIAVMMIDTINNMLIELYSSLAQAENEKRKKRQQEGIAAMRDRGEWSKYGRPRQMSLDKFGEEYQGVIAGTIKPFELMKKLEMKTTTFYKYRDEYLKKLGIKQVKQYKNIHNVNEEE